MRPVHVGCSGWNYSDWRETVYPKGLPARLWLEHYATLFDTVEVNATFYRLPKRETVAHWVEVTPDDFVFSIKASRYLTHIKRLRDLGKYLGNLLERLEPLLETPKMGPLLWQLPPTFQRDDERLFAALEQMPKLRNTIEFRHPSWFVPEVYELLSSYGVALAIADSPKYPFWPVNGPPIGPSSGFTTGPAAGAATTRRPSSRPGSGGSHPGAPKPRCSSTPTTTGRRSRSATRPGFAIACAERFHSSSQYIRPRSFPVGRTGVRSVAWNYRYYSSSSGSCLPCSCITRSASP